nr:FAD-binding protein [Halorientalis sp.]
MIQPDRGAGGASPDLTDETVDVSVLVIGAGAAGARTAIELVEQGIDPEDVLVIGKRAHGDAHATWARGGINGALGTHDPEDDPAIHAADTLKEGHFLNDPGKVEMVTRRMPRLLRELDDWGMAYSRTAEGDIDQRYFGAQSFRRTAFAGDHTGESLLDTLVAKAQSLSVPYRENVFISRVLTDDARIRFVHTVPDAPAVDIWAGDAALFENVAFRKTSSFATVDADAYDIDVRPAGADDSVLNLSEVAFDGATSYTVLATGMLGDDTLDAVLVADYVTTEADDRTVAP